MQRRVFATGLATLGLLGVAAASGQGAEKIGVLMMHGKNPGSASDPSFRPMMYRLEREGMLVLMPQMPWSSTRYREGDWDGAMQEVEQHVATLRAKGATRIVLMGHSMGCAAALSYAVRKQDVHALVLFAPGHAPYYYYSAPMNAEVRQAIDEARAMVASGRGDEQGSFKDNNQGRFMTVRMRAKDYLSFFDPGSDADMGVSAPKVPASVPVLTVVGDADPLFRVARTYLQDKLPPNSRSKYLEVRATHITTPDVGRDEAIAWIRDAVKQD
jgi:pimeloyl-ACP methyl ester carboxylesterase